MQPWGIRVLGIADRQESEFLPGVKTLESPGYRVNVASSHDIAGPAGLPKEIVDMLTAALKKILRSDELKKEYTEMGLSARYMDPGQSAADWAAAEADTAPLIELTRK